MENTFEINLKLSETQAQILYHAMKEEITTVKRQRSKHKEEPEEIAIYDEHLDFLESLKESIAAQIAEQQEVYNLAKFEEMRQRKTAENERRGNENL